MNKIFKSIAIFAGAFSSLWGGPFDLNVSHTEGKGLGYSEGYTSLEFIGAFNRESFVPFVELNGHVFNNGHFASNVGVGLRWLDLSCTTIWGANFFYDTFLLKRLPGHQVSFGLELLTENWDFSMNGYLPVGKKKTNIYTLSYDFSNGFLAKAREQLAMGGIDLEAGYHCYCSDLFDLYAALGPYFYWGKTKETKNAFRAVRKEAYGGRVRASAVIQRWIELEGVASYDSRFKWSGQATISLNLLELWNACSATSSCCLQDKLMQPVRRHEMMVIDTVHRFSTNPLILDPEFEP